MAEGWILLSPAAEQWLRGTGRRNWREDTGMAHTRATKAEVVEWKWGSNKSSGTLGMEGSSACWRSNTHSRHCRSS